MFYEIKKYMRTGRRIKRINNNTNWLVTTIIKQYKKHAIIIIRNKISILALLGFELFLRYDQNNKIAILEIMLGIRSQITCFGENIKDKRYYIWAKHDFLTRTLRNEASLCRTWTRTYTHAHRETHTRTQTYGRLQAIRHYPIYTRPFSLFIWVTSGYCRDAISFSRFSKLPNPNRHTSPSPETCFSFPFLSINATIRFYLLSFATATLFLRTHYHCRTEFVLLAISLTSHP